VTQADVLAVLYGALAGFVLALIGGGSVLATPLLLYVVGVPSDTPPLAPARWRCRPMRC
jgi:uncharacterized membrane protein YfcA